MHRVLNVVKHHDAFDVPVTWSTCWGKGFFLRFASPEPNIHNQQPNWVWEKWTRAKLHPTTKDFIQRALWHKLLVHEHIFALTSTADSPLRGKREMVYHALPECKFYPVVFDFLHKSWGGGVTKSLGSVDDPDDGSTRPLTAKELARQGQEFHSLKEPLGHLLWVAREADWALRWHWKEGGTVALQKFFSVWSVCWSNGPQCQGGGGKPSGVSGLNNCNSPFMTA